MAIAFNSSKFIARMSEGELYHILETKPDEFSKVEIGLVKEELKRRGLISSTHNTDVQSSGNTKVDRKSIGPKPRLTWRAVTVGFIGLACLCMLAYFLLRPSWPPSFSSTVSRRVLDTSVSYVVKIKTDPGVSVDCAGVRRVADNTSELEFLIPARTLALSLDTIEVNLNRGGNRTSQTIQIDNRPNFQFGLDPLNSSFHVAQDGKWWFLVDFQIERGVEVIADGEPVKAESDGSPSLELTFSGVNPLAIQTLTRRFSLLFRTEGHSIWEGYADITFQFPKPELELHAFGKNVIGSSTEEVTYTGAIVRLKVRVNPRALIDRVLLYSMPVPLTADGSYEISLSGLPIGSNEVPFVIQGKDGSQITRTVLFVREATNAERIAEYKRKASRISYAMLSKNPDKYKGEFVVFLGKIFNIKEDESGATIQVNVTQQYLGFWDDQVMVYYPHETDFIENNLVWICGTVRGSYSYQSVAGWNLTVPLIDAEYLGRYEAAY